MKGTIDQVDAFYCGVSSVPGRVLALFATMWVSFGLAVVSIVATIRLDDDFHLRADFNQGMFGDWYLLPVAWLVSLLASCVKMWGIPYMAYLLGVLYAVFILEADMARTAALLFVMQGLHVFALALYEYEFDRDLIHGAWHPLLPFLFACYAYLLWRTFMRWKAERDVSHLINS